MARHPWWLGLVGVGLGAMLARRIVSRDTDLRGAVALVTGGSRGLGLQIARELVDRGARVAICGRDPDTLHRAATELRERGGDVVAVPADLTDPDETRSMVRRVRTLLGPIDVLVNNAGRIEVGPLDTMTDADLEADLALHVWAPLRLVHEVLPEMRARGRGHIVNITSIGGRVAVPRMLPYSVSKHALVGLSRGLRVELARDGITVTTVIPGLMNTGSPRNASFKGRHAEEHRWFALADRAPGLSVDPERAARRIVDAIARGRTELVIGAPARLALLLDAIAPRATYALAAAADRWLLPEPGDDPTAWRGRESATETTRSLFAGRARRAERRLNQEVP